MCKFFFFILSSFIIFFSSCSNKEIDLFGENVKELEELIEWSINHKPADIGIEKYRPVSSITLSDMVSLEKDVDSIVHNQGTIIAVLYFNENEDFLNKSQKELLILVSKAQIFEDFNILIESNNIKAIMPDIIGQIKENLLSNGIKNNYISLNYLKGSNKKLIIKLIKLL
ncbi:hypothetical protein OAC06_04790 [Alphaproteobacteria bacterium]|nr:hypothetical protein [Alphaproteobacteria bacterium]